MSWYTTTTATNGLGDGLKANVYTIVELKKIGHCSMNADTTLLFKTIIN